MGVMIKTLSSDDHRLLPDGYGWSCFQEEAIKLASGQRSDRPKIAMEVILQAANGYAACTVTNAALAKRLGCKPEAVGPVLAILERLALVRCIRDPRIREGRWIVLAQHFAASAVLTELAQSRRVIARNEDLEPLGDSEMPTFDELEPGIEKLFGREHMLRWRAYEESEAATEAEPDILAFDKYLGPALAERERRRQRYAPLYRAAF